MQTAEGFPPTFMQMCASGIRKQQDLQVVQTLLHASHLYSSDPTEQVRLAREGTTRRRHFA